MSLEGDIEKGERMKTLLRDPVFAGAVEKLRGKYFAEFNDAKTHGASVGAWSKGQALRDLLVEMQAVVDNGVRASTEAARQAKSGSGKSK